jgi:steroid 5-alpha reductase family enzyme
MDPQDPEQSVRRIRRGCFGMSALVLAMTVLLVSSTGNLAFGMLAIVAIALFIFSRTLR